MTNFIWVEAKLRPFIDENGNLAAVRGVARDITHRKHADTMLKESELRYRSIIESLHDGYYEVDLSGALSPGKQLLYPHCRHESGRHNW